MKTQMKLEEIKAAVRAGKTVHWASDNYEVIEAKAGFFIKSKFNNHYIGLTHADGVTMNGKIEDFYTKEEDPLTQINLKIEQVLASSGAHNFLKDMLRKGVALDCIDAYYDAKLVADLLKERMDAVLAVYTKEAA